MRTIEKIYKSRSQKKSNFLAFFLPRKALWLTAFRGKKKHPEGKHFLVESITVLCKPMMQVGKNQQIANDASQFLFSPSLLLVVC